MRRVLFYFRKVKRKVRRNSINNKKYLELKGIAIELVKTRLEYWNLHYKLTYGRVSVKNHVSRWGSCSSKGNLNFNYRIAELSSKLVDYIIVHELCHRAQFNHSKKFWDLVGETIPNYLECRAELKKIRIN